MKHNSVIPFYVAYPNYRMYSDEYKRMQDLEYLQAMYPVKVREYQKVIGRVLDGIDYTGSMIYDEFPDRISLYKLANDITTLIMRETEQKENQRPDMDEEEHIRMIVQILLYNEIHKRRNARNDGFIIF